MENTVRFGSDSLYEIIGFLMTQKAKTSFSIKNLHKTVELLYSFIKKENNDRGLKEVNMTILQLNMIITCFESLGNSKPILDRFLNDLIIQFFNVRAIN